MVNTHYLLQPSFLWSFSPFLIFTKPSQKVTIIFDKSVHPDTSQWLSLDFHEISYLGLFLKSVNTFQIWLKLDKITDTLHKELSTFVISMTQSRYRQMLNTQWESIYNGCKNTCTATYLTIICSNGDRWH